MHRFVRLERCARGDMQGANRRARERIGWRNQCTHDQRSEHHETSQEDRVRDQREKGAARSFLGASGIPPFGNRLGKSRARRPSTSRTSPVRCTHAQQLALAPSRTTVTTQRARNNSTTEWTVQHGAKSDTMQKGRRFSNETMFKLQLRFQPLEALPRCLDQFDLPSTTASNNKFLTKGAKTTAQPT